MVTLGENYGGNEEVFKMRYLVDLSMCPPFALSTVVRAEINTAEREMETVKWTREINYGTWKKKLTQLTHYDSEQVQTQRRD